MKLERGGPWIETGGPESDVVVSSRARLARNLVGFPFVNQASGDQCKEILRLVKSLELSDHSMQWLDVVDLEEAERQLLVERHLVSRNFIDAEMPRGLLIGDGERLSVMVNEEDHLRMQVLLPGCELQEAWRRASDIDRKLEQNVELSVHPRWGYLTACPTNVGTAIRFSVMTHRPALRMTNEIERLRRAANALDLAVRGFYGEGSESTGDFYQVSNQITLGVADADLLERFIDTIVPRIVEYERMARRMMLERSRMQLEDRVHRSLGLLRSAKLLGVEEAMKHLSRVRLGVSMGLLDNLKLATVQRLFLDVQPGHLRMNNPDLPSLPGSVNPRQSNDEAIRLRRAEIVRKALSS